ncbi:SGNH/GDSL hydrolase family protein [Streptomyces carpaticus]|uniref:SGNH/GDSL hydrolase family protein n=1 Tax=Streptomyces carpaticus TaxID=285558 RepID=A0ABV4ZR63_9ACTN
MGAVGVRRGPAWAAAGVVAVLVVVAAVLAGFPGGDGRGLRPAPGPPGAVVPASQGAWVGAWSAAPTGAEPGTRDGLGGRSLRNAVQVSAGGPAVRVELSNRYGSQPVTFTRASVGLAVGAGPEAVAGSVLPLAFGGRSAVTIPVGGVVLSDAVGLAVEPADRLLVSVYAPGPSGPVTYHRHAREVNFAARGEHTRDEAGVAYTTVSEHWRYLTGVQVFSPVPRGAVVVLGDSLTDGITATPGAGHRWTDFLAARLAGRPVLNLGISGNRLLRDSPPGRAFNGPSGLSRLHSDVLRQEGAEVLIVQLGINDILREPRQLDAERITAGLDQLAREARAGGLRVVGATLMPFEGHYAWTPELEAVRLAVNERLRSGGVFDGLVDLDAALRDPARPSRLLPVFDSGDGLHPTDAGYEAMAGAVDPGVLEAGVPAPA